MGCIHEISFAKQNSFLYTLTKLFLKRTEICGYFLSLSLPAAILGNEVGCVTPKYN